MQNNVKNLKNKAILVEVERKKVAGTFLKMKKLHEIKIKTYAREILNPSRDVIRRKELSHCSIEKIKTKLKKISVRRNEKN